MRNVGGLKGTGEELRTKEGKVVMDGKELGFCVKMVNGTHLHTADGYAEGGVLDTLEFLDGGGGGVREPDRDGVSEEGGDETFVCMLCPQEIPARTFRLLRRAEA